ncbi:MAG: UDP-N-acetylglucosamine--N-acetylmuramyl-(pentapeptide) pyrophosphoryl-undecaprenol N-acetylglucosamine transferase [Acidimicrobiales bacterium]
MAPARRAVSDRRFALVAGGGTAGHLQPALAIAEALVERGHPRASIEFVGSERGQDRAVLDGRGFPVTLLPGRGIVRSLRVDDLVNDVRAACQLVLACVRGVGVLRRTRPRVVVSVGGYASLPASFGAVLFGVPLVLVNVDAVPGAANRLFARLATASAVGWEGTDLPRAVVTGTPVRQEIAAVRRRPEDRRESRQVLGLPEDRPTVVVFGGSLGARRINEAIDGLAGLWAHRSDRSIYHIVGRRDWSRYLEDSKIPEGPPGGHRGGDAAPGPGLVLRRVDYEHRMASVYAAADVVVCRAGAMTVAELAVAGVAAILVPLPGAPSDHQTANARVLEAAGAAVLIPDAVCDAASLAGTLDAMLADDAGLEARSRAAAALGRADAAAAGAAVVEAGAECEHGRFLGSVFRKQRR